MFEDYYILENVVIARLRVIPLAWCTIVDFEAHERGGKSLNSIQVCMTSVTDKNGNSVIGSPQLIPTQTCD